MASNDGIHATIEEHERREPDLPREAITPAPARRGRRVVCNEKCPFDAVGVRL